LVPGSTLSVASQHGQVTSNAGAFFDMERW
jgi:hypothetical protein